VEELLVSHLFRSLCPVTAQPDWASIFVQYQGAPISREGLLAYLISYRQHQAFHETTIERIYEDIWQACRPMALAVSGRFLRRGGLEINPFRTSSVEDFGGTLSIYERMARQ
jgi:7-cyano-7-deazaguanine reductase